MTIPLREAAEKAGIVKPVAWLHPTAGWAHVDYANVEQHCNHSGPYPIPLVPASALDTARKEVERLREAWREAEAIVEACAIARDEVGYLGKIDDCIRSQETALTEAKARIAELEGVRVRISYALYGDGNDPGHSLNDVAGSLIALARRTISPDTAEGGPDRG